MKKFILLSIIVQINLLCVSAVLHQALEYVPKGGSKAAIRQSMGPGADAKQIQKRKEEGRGSISNVDLPRIAKDYWDYWTTGVGKSIDLITDETKRIGYPKLGLLADDIKNIENFIRKFFMSQPSAKGAIPYSYLEFAHSKLPDWLAQEYEHKTYDLFDFITINPKYSFLGPSNIRSSVAEFIFQKWLTSQPNSKRYWHVKKGFDISANVLAKIKKNIDEALSDAQTAFKYIDQIQNNQIESTIQYIIVPAANIRNQNVVATLNAILDPQTGNPNLKIIIAFNDTDQEISDYFYNQVIPQSIQNLVIVGQNIRTIGDFFLSYCAGVRSIDLTPLANVTNIGRRFLSHCTGLTSLDLTPLANVTTIENDFLLHCASLTCLDLTPLAKVTTIRNWFLFGCHGLRSLDLTPLANVTNIGPRFLFWCSGLTSLDLTPLTSVTTIRDGFLSNCSGLTSLDLTPLTSVTTLGDSFLSGCTGLTSLDLTPLTSVTTLGDDFLSGCNTLNDLKIERSFFKKLSEIDQERISKLNLIIIQDGAAPAAKSSDDYLAAKNAMPGSGAAPAAKS